MLFSPEETFSSIYLEQKKYLHNSTIIIKFINDVYECSGKQILEPSLLWYFNLENVLYSHLELRYNPEQKINREIS